MISPFALRQHEILEMPARVSRSSTSQTIVDFVVPGPDSSEDEASAPSLSAAAEVLLGVQKDFVPSVGLLQPLQPDDGHYPHRKTRKPFQRTHKCASKHPHLQGHPHRRIVRLNSSPRSFPTHRATSSPIVGSVQRSRSLGNETSISTIRHSPGLLVSSLQQGEKSSAVTLARNNSNAVRSVTPAREDAGIFEVETNDCADSRAALSESCGPSSSSLRIKRVSKVAGRYLRGPARRGVGRKLDEDGQDNAATNQDIVYTPMEQDAQDGLSSGPCSSSAQPTAPNGPVVVNRSGLAGLQRAHQPLVAQVPSAALDGLFSPLEPSSIRLGPMILPIRQDSAGNSSLAPGRCSFEAASETSERPAVADSKQRPEQLANRTAQPRRALTPLDHNVPLPLNTPPPPPQMASLQTAIAGNGVTSSFHPKRPRHTYTLNGKRFTRMEFIGRGGSGKVYRVMAENFELFALKRVSLQGIDDAAIRGFKGEIDLLRKLGDVERVIHLHDFEINEEKQTLSVLMDIADLDLKKLLDPRVDVLTGRFDATFARYIWKEMLECVESIHRFDVVHSDLKPANFVMVHSRLKLIDFGIAGTILDNTVNVHRSQQIGTPNYMAPEALLDANALNASSSAMAKVMKLGKPSDIWSLGCILYQITYGKPPFGHINSTAQKVMAIVDPSFKIEFPNLGVGKIRVPASLITTLRNCLNRDPNSRPTAQILLEQDGFLYPDAPSTVLIDKDVFLQIQNAVVQKIKETGNFPQAGDLSLWHDELAKSTRVKK